MTAASSRRGVSPTEAGRTSPETICARVRRGIIRGDYPPGHRLTEDALADEFGVSRIPIREALRVLASEGFVRVQPYYGTFVSELTAEQAGDLLAVRGALEPLAAALAAERRTPDQLAALISLINQGRAATDEKRYDDVSALNGTFHELLAEASGSPTVLTLISQLRDKIDWVYSVEVRRRAGDSWAEHEEIVSAVADRDSTRASAAARDHVDHALNAYRLRTPASPGPMAVGPVRPD
jgi:DNA-binding GntR family transcriptional regulator